MNREKNRICQKCDAKFVGLRSKLGNWCTACVDMFNEMNVTRICDKGFDARCTGKYLQTRENQDACLFCMGVNPETMDELLRNKTMHYQLWMVQKV
jgi:hypothetical protein